MASETRVEAINRIHRMTGEETMQIVGSVSLGYLLGQAYDAGAAAHAAPTPPPSSCTCLADVMRDGRKHDPSCPEAAPRATGEQPDWTIDPVSHRSNSSPQFVALVDEVARLIRSDAHALIGGQIESVARLIMAQLAHVHHLVPSTHAAPAAQPEERK